MSVTLDNNTGILAVLLINGGSSKIVTLPLASSRIGRIVTIKDVNGYATNSTTIIINTTNPDVIDGNGSSYLINQAYGIITLTAESAGKWSILNESAIRTITGVNITVNATDPRNITLTGETVDITNTTNISTVNGLGSIGYISSFEILVDNLGSVGYISSLLGVPYVSSARIVTSSIESKFINTTTNSNSEHFLLMAGTHNEVGVIKYSFDDGYSWSDSKTRYEGTTTNGCTAQTAIAYNGNDLYVAAGVGATSPNENLKYSSNGFEWYNAASVANLENANDVIYVPSLNTWIAVGQFNTGSNTIVYSGDGFNWSNATGNTFDVEGKSLTTDNTLIVASGIDTSTSLLYSTDGIDWAYSNISGAFSASTGYANSLHYANSLWCMSGTLSGLSGNTYYSLDGSNWNAPSSLGTFSIMGYGVFYGGSTWVAVGDDTDLGGVRSIQTSTDGSNWNNLTNVLPVSRIMNSVFYNSQASNWLITTPTLIFPTQNTTFISTDPVEWNNTVVNNNIIYDGSQLNNNFGLRIINGTSKENNNNYTALTIENTSRIHTSTLTIGNPTTNDVNQLHVSGRLQSDILECDYAVFNKRVSINSIPSQYNLNVGGCVLVSTSLVVGNSLMSGTAYNSYSINGYGVYAEDAFYSPTGTIQTPSDRHIKRDIESANLTRCYSTIQSIPLRKYGFVDSFNTGRSDKSQLGFIADELGTFFPKSIREGKTHFQGFSSISYVSHDQIYMSHVGATKHMMSILEQQQSTITGQQKMFQTLMTRLNEMETKVTYCVITLDKN